jgi:DNA excision repair protein ERCC-2
LLLPAHLFKNFKSRMRFPVDGLDVFFPYDFVYREQYQYMVELKRALDAKGDALLEMPTGTGKTVSLLALILSYQTAHPERSRLVYCTRTVPEMAKTVEEVKRVVAYRAEQLVREAGGDDVACAEARVRSLGPKSDILAVCLSSRRNMCVHAPAASAGDREGVDGACRSLTASWVRAEAEAGKPGVKTCPFFEGLTKEGADFDLRGVYDLDDLKEVAKAKGWCPYFLVRQVLCNANVVVFSYQ